MNTYTIHYNRTTAHIAPASSAVSAEAMNNCGSLTLGNLAKGKAYDTAAEALEAAEKSGRRVCKTCAKVLAQHIEEETAPAEVAEEAPAPVTESVEVIEMREIEPGRVYWTMDSFGAPTVWKVEGLPKGRFATKEEAKAAWQATQRRVRPSQGSRAPEGALPLGQS